VVSHRRRCRERHGGTQALIAACNRRAYFCRLLICWVAVGSGQGSGRVPPGGIRSARGRAYIVREELVERRSETVSSVSARRGGERCASGGKRSHGVAHAVPCLRTIIARAARVHLAANELRQPALVGRVDIHIATSRESLKRSITGSVLPVKRGPHAPPWSDVPPTTGATSP
jgi:hypothetical protein